MKSWNIGVMALIAWIFTVSVQPVRAGTAGELDAGFGEQGRVIRNYSIYDGSETARALAMTADGGMLVAGSGGYLSKLDASGNLVRSFGSQGRVTVRGGWINAIAVQASGKILLAFDNTVTRLNSDGSVDTAFGVNGQLKGLGFDELFSMVLAQNGDILLGGAWTYYDSAFDPGDLAPQVTRLDPEGHVVATNGWHVFNRSLSITSIKEMPDGRIQVAGMSGIDTSVATPFTARFDAALKFDSSFGTGGIKYLSDNLKGFYDKLEMALYSDGRVLLSGTKKSSSQFFVERLDAQGGIDATFGHNGTVLSTFAGPATASAIKLRSGGKILVMGSVVLDGQSSTAFTRLNSNGTADESFAPGGQKLIDFGRGLNDSAASLTLLADGSMLVTGSVATSTSAVNMLVGRLLSDVTLDKSFGSGGRSILNRSNGDDTFYDVAMQDNYTVDVGSAFNGHDNEFLVTRFDAKGANDESFGQSGHWKLDLSDGDDIATAISTLSDGKILVAGLAKPGNTSSDLVVLRLTHDGQIDPGFGAAGITRFPTGQVFKTTHLWLQADAKILLTTDSGLIVRLNSDGSPDSTFNAGLITQLDMRVSAATQLPSGKYLLAGAERGVYGARLMRLQTDGSADIKFGVNGIFDDSNYFGQFESVHVDGAGKIVLAGTYQYIDNDYLEFYFYVGFERVNAGGTLDKSFGDKNGYSQYLIGSYGSSTQILFSPKDEKYYAINEVSDPSWLQSIWVSRFNSNGLLDTGFDLDGKKQLEINMHSHSLGASLTFQGDLLLAGAIGSYTSDVQLLKVLGSDKAATKK